MDTRRVRELGGCESSNLPPQATLALLPARSQVGGMVKDVSLRLRNLTDPQDQWAVLPGASTARTVRNRMMTSWVNDQFST